MTHAEHYSLEGPNDKLDTSYRREIDDELKKSYNDDEHWTLAIGGDKAYPSITVPHGMKTYVASSAQSTIDSASPQSSSSFSSRGAQQVSSLSNRRCWPQTSENRENLTLHSDLAPYRAAVERVMLRIKRYKILTSGQIFESRQKEIELLIKALAGMANCELEGKKVTHMKEHEEEEENDFDETETEGDDGAAIESERKPQKKKAGVLELVAFDDKKFAGNKQHL